MQNLNTNKLICLTPVRNEAWILRAFLTATSLWADYIIIVDQGSTDGSRDIALQFPKVILIDNPAKEMHQAQTRKLLFEEGKKIKGNKIFFALDADEFLSGDFLSTESWKSIVNANKNEVFYFRWINLCQESDYCYMTDLWMNWAVCFNDEDVETIYPDSYIHEWRLPYPKDCSKEIQIKDIYFIHFGAVNINRGINKNRFYQVITKFKQPELSFVKLYRQYHSYHSLVKEKVNPEIYQFYDENNLNIFELIDFEDTGKYYSEQVIEYFNKKGIRFFDGLDIWDKNFLEEQNLEYHPSIKIKLLFSYLKTTQYLHQKIYIKFIDKVLSKII